MNRNLRSVIAAMGAALLVGCGGGGSSEPIASTESFPIKQAYQNYLTETRSLPFTVSGVLNGISVSGSGTYSQSQLQATTFEGASALKKSGTATLTLVGNGQTVPLAVTTARYVDANYTPLGSESSSDYLVVTGTVAIPATGKVGDNGEWFTENVYTDSTKNTRTGSQTTSFVLEADSGSTALLKIIEIERNTVGAQTATSTVNFRITTTGTLTRLSESATTTDGTLTVTY